MNHPDSRRIVVRHQAVGFHRWPDAPPHRDYLAVRHRHLFHIEVTIDVDHDDREVEFHDLLDVVTAAWPGPELGSKSCEAAAAALADAVNDRWPGRAVTVGVFEDGECGAVLSWREEPGYVPNR